MDKELKAKWIEALRSGKYLQCHKKLHTQEGFCCLGVLCDLQGFKWTMDVALSKACNCNTFYIDVDKIGDEEYDYLPLEFAEKLGITRKATIQNLLTRNQIYGHQTLADLNDSGFTFNQIADVIEYFF